MPENNQSTEIEPLKRLTRDLRNAAKTMTPDEARYLVDAYYQMQENRIRSQNQIRAGLGDESSEPHETLGWLLDNTAMLERNIKNALDAYSSAGKTGQWSKSIVGIGPVIAAGLLAHIDITKAKTVGHIHRFAGLDSTVKWQNAEECKKWINEQLTERYVETGQHSTPDQEFVYLAAAYWGRNAESLLRLSTTDFRTKKPVALTNARLASALARRPWNANLKTLCWKIGESFVKVSGNENDFYGKLYMQRKAQEILKNDAGEFKQQAEDKLKRFKIGKDTDAFKAYSSGKLPPAHIHARAKRWAVKLFLSHWHSVAYYEATGTKAPRPYVIEHMGHTDVIETPNWPF